MAKGDERKPRTDTSGPENRRDEVDASKGIFPADVPHPEGAERRMAGEIGGGPYEESGRSGPGVGAASPPRAREEEHRAARERREGEERRSREHEEEPKGELPPHRESAG